MKRLNSIFNQRTVTSSGITVVVLGVLLTYFSQWYYSTVNNSWKKYSQEAVELYSYHDQLVQALGYGGFIHSFKNLILRKDIARYSPQISQSLSIARDNLKLLERDGDYELKSILHIRNTLDEYEKGYQTAITMIEAGSTTEQIDSIVKVSDVAALEALRQFDSQLQKRLTNEKRLLSQQFSIAYNIQIFTAALFILLIGIYVFVVISSIKKQLKLTNEALQSAEAKSSFLANMSHEIRTPMNGVMGTLQLLQRDTPKGKNLLLVKKAMYSTRSLIQIINDILDFSKIEAGELAIEEIGFSFTEIIESVSSDMLPKAISKKVDMVTSTSALTTDYWLGDPIRIRQVVLNIVSNAVKFTEKGSVNVAVSEVDSEDKCGVLIKVIDTGIGMTEAAVSRLFKRFTQADESTTRKFGGTGLGMSISKNLVDLMDGEIKVVSRKGEGTSFEVYLPLQKSLQSHAQRHEDIENTAPDLKGKTILIADDNDINQMIVANMLEVTSAKTILAFNGIEAIEQFKKEAPDVILMDIQMPEMDGLEACLKIKELDEKIPIIALTANVMKEDIEKYRNAGFSGHLGKPFEINQLFKILSGNLI